MSAKSIGSKDKKISRFSESSNFKITALMCCIEYNREGYNSEGYDKNGYDRNGFNKAGYDKDGYDRDGFSIDGYDRDGYDRNGFNRKGYNRSGYDVEGFDLAGYDKAGFDRYGYDRTGYNSNGIDRAGYNRDGYDAEGYDANGFDIDGYNHDGYNVDGFDREGFDKEGYDCDGFNRDGVDRLGYDREGYDAEGYDVNGFDKEGYNRKGFNTEGYNREGYDEDGYNRQGYDTKGYDRDGYDVKGYDKRGYNRDGYDVSGYDRDGFDKKGYDRDGYNRSGYTIDGYDRAGYDRLGFDKKGFDKEGFDIRGRDSEGYNILGYDSFGFDRNGFHRDGFSKADFDEAGFHLFTGYNLQGYDREGFNINGYDKDGYDRKGYDIDGYNRKGYDRKGFNRIGYNKKGFNKFGFDSTGYDKEGYDKEGFSKSGYDREGFDQEGYDAEGYDRYGYDRDGKPKQLSVHDLQPGMSMYHKTYGQGTIVRFEDNRTYVVIKYPFSSNEFTYEFPQAVGKYLSLEKTEKIKQREDNTSTEEDKKEKKWYSNLARYLKLVYLPKMISRAEAGFEQRTIDYMNPEGFWESREIGPGVESVREKVNSDVNLLVENPYFSHIDYSKNSNLYIGKKEIPGYVTDWADKKASIYFQYQMYIGNKKTGLNFVREIDFGDGKYLGYIDLYNAMTTGTKNTAKYADERLVKIIRANQKNKNIHDIIETIQQNQYKIITEDKENDILVLGCAGSGKTMILMHRIRYMKYNNPNMDMKSVMVISPTDVLGRESRELSKILDVSAVQQFTMTGVYRSFILEMLETYYQQPYLLKDVDLDDGLSNIDFYDQAVLDKALNRVLQCLNIGSDISVQYRRNKAKSIGEFQKLFHAMHGGYHSFQHKQSLYYKAKEELTRYSKEDYLKVFKRCRSIQREIDELKSSIKFAELVYGKARLKVDKRADEEKRRKTYNFTGVLRSTKMLAACVDIDEVYRFIRKNNVSCESTSKFIQLLCAFCSDGQDIDKNLLISVRRELEEYTDTYMFAYILSLKSRVRSLEMMPRKADIIEALMSQDLIKNGNSSDLNDQEILNLGSDLLQFFDEMEWKKENPLPFSDFEQYDQLLAKTRRMKEFEKKGNKWIFLQDIMCDELQISQDDGSYSLDESKLFAFVYILQRISNYIINDKRFVFVDEFQDFANTEIAFLCNIMPHGKFNLFGDYLQCINPKGIESADSFDMRLIFKKEYHINENYRNAKAITKYVNNRFGMNMLEIGLVGGVITKKSPIPMKLEKDDRGAIIVSDTYQGTIDISGVDILDFSKEGVIRRNVFNIIPVSKAKGLEFEKVIAITEGMTENQKYVACTRAIKGLQIIE